MITHYRIVDTGSCSQILANAIPTLEQAQQLLELLALDYPEIALSIEAYTVADPK
jgi:hypothetical protein